MLPLCLLSLPVYMLQAATKTLRRRYCEAPAGKGVHGAYLHGLLEHVVRQAELAEAAGMTSRSVQ